MIGFSTVVLAAACNKCVYGNFVQENFFTGFFQNRANEELSLNNKFSDTLIRLKNSRRFQSRAARQRRPTNQPKTVNPAATTTLIQCSPVAYVEMLKNSSMALSACIQMGDKRRCILAQGDATPKETANLK